MPAPTGEPVAQYGVTSAYVTGGQIVYMPWRDEFPPPLVYIKATDIFSRELPGWVRSGRGGRHRIKPVQR